jgi:hypothetical protein
VAPPRAVEHTQNARELTEESFLYSVVPTGNGLMIRQTPESKVTHELE